MKINTISLIIFLGLCYSLSYAQSSLNIKDSISWNLSSPSSILHIGPQEHYWSINNGYNIKESPELPIYSTRIAIPYNANPEVIIKTEKSSSIEIRTPQTQKNIGSEIKIHTFVTQEKNQFYLGISFIPVYKDDFGTFRKIDAFTLNINLVASTTGYRKSPPFAKESILKSGSFYKLGIEKEGVYKIDYNYLQDTLGLNLSTINPKKISIYGNGGGTVAEELSANRIDDLAENAIHIEGEADGVFNENDFILFFAEGPHNISFDPDAEKYITRTNPYDTKNYYFLNIGTNEGKRITNNESGGSSQKTFTTSDYITRHETESVNLLGDFASTQGSGQIWMGEELTKQRELAVTQLFDFNDIDISQDIEVDFSFYGRTTSANSVQLEVDQWSKSIRISPVNTEDVEAIFARKASINENLNFNSTNPSITIKYPGVESSSSGWLDYLQFLYKRNLSYQNFTFIFFNKESLAYENASFSLQSNSNDLLIWNITDLQNVSNQLYQPVAGGIEFTYNTENRLKKFTAFDPRSISAEPTYIAETAAQNLHALDRADLLIVYHPDFIDAANLLASHRESHTGLTIALASTEEIYNEFSSGRQDPTAIRDLAKMVYDRDPNFNFLLLIGDGSYDFRHINKKFDNQSFVPAYETKESLNPLTAFPTDDYYALLSDNEGASLRGALDIAVGRLPAKSLDEATNMVNKIIRYDTDPKGNGDWKNRIAFTADDEDSNIHLNQADNIAKLVDAKHPIYNQEKIYFDAFTQISTPGGARYPDATEKLNNEIFKGLLLLNYLGHGGSKGWSQERVLKTTDINKWSNKNKMPLIITATCSFTGFDDPALVTGGEEAILNKDGGAIALFSTVRSVYSSQNFRLTKSVFDTIFTIENGEPLAIGEILRRAKNSNSADTINVNARKFLLIGDPSMKLSLPELKIRTTSINGNSIIASNIDTLSALQSVTIAGEIVDQNFNVIDDFNGTVFPTLYDKKLTVETLSNDPGSPKKQFIIQRNILFSGTATVSEGKFSFEFVIPKDINYNYGNGKLSYYATNNNLIEATGSFDGFIIGGTDTTILSDNKGPEVKLFMNDENFVNGGITTTSPELLVKLYDENGINFSGNSIGHDITAILDENTQETIVLNEFYKSEKDDFKNGIVRYPLSKLSPGKHTLTLKAFDIANNAGEGFLEFLVTDESDIKLTRVLNYPNPFTTSTNFMFEHNLVGLPLDILINIYTVSGKLIKSITRQSAATGFREDDIHWDGTDDYGNQLGRGIYLYQIKVRNEELNIAKESNFEKLLLLR